MQTDQTSGSRSLSYYVLITSVNGATFSQAATELARNFNLVPEVAVQILNSPPIIFLSDLNKSDLEAIKLKLLKLSHPNLGLEFLITTKLSPTVPRVVWPTPPHYKKLESGEVVRYVDFQWRGSAFVCPNCGETFLFRRVGNPFARFVKAKTEKGTGEPILLTQDLPTPEPIPVLEPVPMAVSDAESEIFGDVMELQPLAEDNELLASGENEVMELAPLEEPDESGDLAAVPEPIDILDNAEAISEDQGLAFMPEAVEITPENVPTVISNAVSSDETTCSVFLSSITSKEKKEQAAKLIAQLKNISFAEATQLLGRVLVPVLKEVTEEEAKKCLDEFKKIGVAGRATKKKK
ncbi:MAG: hypothetical protein AAB019_00080 [Planctomycetota bacterium]